MSTDSSSTQGELESQLAPSLEKGAETEQEQNTPQKKPVWIPSPAPDGGLTAWSVLAGSWCVLFCSFGWINSVGTFQNYYQSTLLNQYSSSTIAWIPSLQIFFMFATGPIIGQLYDRYGPRYLLLVGSLLHVFGLMMTSISTQYYQVLLSQGVVSAIGVATVFQPSLNVIPGWFDKKRGIAYGIAASGSSIGGIIFPIMVQKLIVQVGYGWSMRIAAFMILGLLTISNLTIKSRFPPQPRSMTREELVQPFREFNTVVVICGFLLLTFGIFIPVDYVVVEALGTGMDPNLAQYLLAMLNAGSLFGRLIAGALADTLGAYNIFSFVCYVSGILVLALWIPASSNAAVIAFAVIFGFTSGAYASLIANLIVKISPNFKVIGYRTGLAFLFASIGGLTTNPIAGAILQHDNGSYTGMKIFSGVCIMAGTTLVFVARLHQTGYKLVAKF
ncbi:hypothetical protein EYB25_009310 [Talaromyces marneffei]|nr:hypothetical protein EYB25_009310 [Talaromyces marneffei]